MLDLRELLEYVVTREGSDLHLKVGAPPTARVHGRLLPLEGYDKIEPKEPEQILREMLLSSQPDKLSEFERTGEVDFAFAIPGLSRFRCNGFRQRGSVSIAIRIITFNIRTVDELGLPPVVTELADEERGLILLTGTTGSGKSTTLAAMIDHINTTKSRHIVTIEDPIEYLFSDKRSIINQREIGMDTESFASAMRRVLRQDPDVILVGEMRDQETVRAALSAGETGHLVLSTVHTLDAPESVNRIVDFFPQHEQDQARAMLAGTLKGVVSQRLVPTIDGQGRVAACEILRVTGRARDMIVDPDQTPKLREVIFEGGYYGMQTFDQSLLHHYKAGLISLDDALRIASSPHDFKLLVASDGRKATTMEDLADTYTDHRGGERGADRETPTLPAPAPAGPSNRPSSPPPIPV